MHRMYQRFLVLLAVIVFSLLVTFNTVYSQPIVKIIMVESTTREIVIGTEEQAMHLIAQTNEPDLQFTWSLSGSGDKVGELKGEETRSTIFYIPPNVIDYISQNVIDKELVEAVITVTVTDDKGRIAKDKVTFTLLVPSLQDLETEQLVKLAGNYLENNYLTTPEVMNAFDICKKILKEDRKNSQAREIIHTIAERYKSWADPKYKAWKEGRHTQKDIDNAKEYYQKYRIVTDYMLKTLKDSSVKSDNREVKNRLKELEKP